MVQASQTPSTDKQATATQCNTVPKAAIDFFCMFQKQHVLKCRKPLFDKADFKLKATYFLLVILSTNRFCKAVIIL